jgi:hypothetical protein
MSVSMIDWDEVMWALPLTFELAGRWLSHVRMMVGGMISLAVVVVQYQSDVVRVWFATDELIPQWCV